MECVFSYNQLFSFATQVFKAMGCTESDASTAATNLLLADLRGVDSHGLARLSGYVRLWEAGRINTNPNIQVTYKQFSTAQTIDADRALGLVAAQKGMQAAIEMAQTNGVGFVAIQNSNHFGIAAAYAMMALPHDMIGFAMTNASAIVAPTYSIDKMLGTNPIAIAVPTGNKLPFVADFATTTASNGKLEILQRKHQETPWGWLQTKDGLPTKNPHALKEGGALLPLGSDTEHSSHKGYMLGAWVDIFSGVLSGANYGPWVPPFPAYIPMPQNMPGKGLGHFVGAWRVDAFRLVEDFKNHMDKWIETFQNAQTNDANSKVIIPGYPEWAMQSYRKLHGIPLLSIVVEDLMRVGAKFHIDL